MFDATLAAAERFGHRGPTRHTERFAMSAVPSRRAVTLVEVLTALTVVGTLFALSASAVQRVRLAAARVACANTLRQLAIAHHGHQAGAGRLPAGTVVQSAPYPHLGWVPPLLQHLDQSPLWDRTAADYRDQPHFHFPRPHALLSHPLRAAACPADARVGQPQQYLGLTVGLSSYLGVAGRDQFARDGVLYADSATALTAVPDGTSSTLLVGERPPSPDFQFGWWYAGIGQSHSGSLDHTLGVAERNTDDGRPTIARCFAGPYRFGPGRLDNPCDAFHFWSLHPGGANFAFCDGSVRFLPYSADAVLSALATRAGGETVALPD